MNPRSDNFLQSIFATAQSYAQATSQYVNAAGVYAQREIFPVLNTSALLYSAVDPMTAPFVLPAMIKYVAEEFKRENQSSPEAESACRQSVKKALFFPNGIAETCKTAPAVAPILAGLLDSVQLTPSGLLMNALFFLGGVLMGLLTGGIWLAIKILAGIGMSAAAAWGMLKGLTDALAQYSRAKSQSTERYSAIRNIGAVAGGLMLIGVMALLGVGAGKLKQRVKDRPTVKSLIAEVKTKFPFLTKPVAHTDVPDSVAPKIVGEKPSVAETARSGKFPREYPKEAILSNASLPNRAARIDAAMKQLGVSRDFAERIAAAHDAVPCPVWECTSAQLLQKMRIMGDSPESVAAIRSGLAGFPPGYAPTPLEELNVGDHPKFAARRSARSRPGGTGDPLRGDLGELAVKGPGQAAQGVTQGRYAGAPPVDLGKQNKHDWLARNVIDGKSLWRPDVDSIFLTQKAWVEGDPVPHQPQARSFFAGRTVGLDGESWIKVHMDSDGRIHGHPSEGPQGGPRAAAPVDAVDKYEALTVAYGKNPDVNTSERIGQMTDWFRSGDYRLRKQIIENVLAEPGWAKYPKLMDGVLANGDAYTEVAIIRKILTLPAWEARREYPRWIEGLLEKKDRLVDREIIDTIFPKQVEPKWVETLIVGGNDDQLNLGYLLEEDGWDRRWIDYWGRLITVDVAKRTEFIAEFRPPYEGKSLSRPFRFHSRSAQSQDRVSKEVFRRNAALPRQARIDAARKLGLKRAQAIAVADVYEEAAEQVGQHDKLALLRFVATDLRKEGLSSDKIRELIELGLVQGVYFVEPGP